LYITEVDCCHPQATGDKLETNRQCKRSMCSFSQVIDWGELNSKSAVVLLVSHLCVSLSFNEVCRYIRVFRFEIARLIHSQKSYNETPTKHRT
jgi:hypothetical protein